MSRPPENRRLLHTKNSHFIHLVRLYARTLAAFLLQNIHLFCSFKNHSPFIPPFQIRILEYASFERTRALISSKHFITLIYRATICLNYKTMHRTRPHAHQYYGHSFIHCAGTLSVEWAIKAKRESLGANESGVCVCFLHINCGRFCVQAA